MGGLPAEGLLGQCARRRLVHDENAMHRLRKGLRAFETLRLRWPCRIPAQPLVAARNKLKAPVTTLRP